MRNIFRLLALLFAFPLLCVDVARAQPATVVITIDYHREGLMNGLAILQPRNLPATFFVGVTSGSLDLIDNYPGILPTSAELTQAQSAGWEIGIYPNKKLTPLVDGTPESEVSMEDFLLLQKSKLQAKGFTAKSVAAPGRAWNATLACLARGIFHQVRVADVSTQWQSYPIPDRYYIRNGATLSLGPWDSVVSLTDQLSSLIAAGGIWYVVVHKIGPQTDDPYMVPTPVFQGFAEALQAARNAGQIRVVTFAQSIAPPTP